MNYLSVAIVQMLYVCVCVYMSSVCSVRVCVCVHVYNCVVCVSVRVGGAVWCVSVVQCV